MPPSIIFLAQSLSAAKALSQNSGSSFFARSVIAFWCSGLIFFQTSLLIATMSDDHCWLVAWKNLRNSQNLPSTPDTAEVDTPDTAPDDSAGSSSPHGITIGAMPAEAQMSCAPLSAVRILMPFSAVDRLGLHLEMEVLVRPRHDIEDRLVVPGRDLLEFGPDVLVQDLQLLGASRRGTERLRCP